MSITGNNDDRLQTSNSNVLSRRKRRRFNRCFREKQIGELSVFFIFLLHKSKKKNPSSAHLHFFKGFEVCSASAKKPKQLMSRVSADGCRCFQRNPALQDAKITAKNAQKLEKIGHLGFENSVSTQLLSNKIWNIDHQLTQKRAKA